MAEIVLENLAHSYPAAAARRAGLGVEGNQLGVARWRRICPAWAVGVRQINVAEHHLRLAVAYPCKILFNGEDVAGLSPDARNIAQVFQFPVVYDTMTVFQNLAFPLRNRGLDEKRGEGAGIRGGGNARNSAMPSGGGRVD